MICLFFNVFQSCTKVAVDFVSPESVEECIKLTEEFRLLPKDHRSKQDILEVCSIGSSLVQTIHFMFLGKSLNGGVWFLAFCILCMMALFIPVSSFGIF